MGRKSKGSKPQSGPTINKIEKYEDTLQEGGVDDYIFKRDQINFEDAPSDDEDINGEQGEEVLGLNWKRAGDDADEDDAEEYEEEADDWAEPKQRKAKAKADLSTKGRFGKEDVSSDEYSEEEGSGSESEEEGWGRQYYSRPSTRREKEKEGEYDAQREEERDMEEREVRRLQRRARETLAEDDWGLDDVEVEYAAPEKVEVAVAVAAPETDDPAVLIRHLQAHEPLALALARDFPLVLRKLRRTAKGFKRMTKEREGEESLHKGLGWLHYQALLTYATTLAFYIHLCALPADERPDMSSHPILQRLLQLKEGVATLEDLDFAAGSISDAGPELFEREGDEDMLEDEDEEEFAAMMAAKRELMGRMQAGGDENDEDAGVPYDEDEDMANLWNADGDGFDDSELADLIADAERGGKKSKKERKRGKKSKKPKADSDDEEATTAFTPMAEPEFVSTKKSKKSKSTLADADATLGDITELLDADAGDKDKRTRSLRFHTSKIAATSARRSAARDKRLGGDDDIPYRDKQAARDAALRKNAPKGNGGEDLDGSEWTDSDRKRAREVRDEADEVDDGGDDGYYDLVKRRKVQKDEDKAAKHEAFLEDKFASFEEFDETTDGPRALTRAIEKNRGLTPRRAKTGRNPRVKKRMAFEKAKQKVGSQRAVFKGGQSALSGSYSGEKTGISTVSKSRKF